MGYFIRMKDGVNIFVQVLNPQGKKTIVFLHGWPGNHNLFEYQLDKLPKLVYRGIGIDQEVSDNRISHSMVMITIPWRMM